jgi:pyruvate formate lyase activating enzyme
VLYSIGYAMPTGFAVDPIEKKPLNHFLPATGILSFGTAGCNLGCTFCQNWTTSKAKSDSSYAHDVSPETVIQLAKREKTPSIAFTYNDPTIIGEYVIDISKLARQENIKSVMVTAGYIDKEARKEVYEYIDAANVDLKAFSDDFYRRQTGASLADILDTILYLKHQTDVWIELTTLLIPGENDSQQELDELTKWIFYELGPDVPLHFTAFHPAFKMNDRERTPASTLERARKTAMDNGIHYCYLGNVHHPEGHTTFCPNCSAVLIQRDWHSVSKNRLKHNSCPDCGHNIAGVF